MTHTHLEYQCPKSGKLIDTGVVTNATGLAENWDKTLRLTCPHCGELHVLVVREAFTASVVSDKRLRGTGS